MNAIIYYEGHVIRGVSFVPDSELERFSSFTVPVETAVQLIEQDISQWFVWEGTNEPNLYNKSAKLKLDFIDDSLVLIKEDMVAAPVSMVIKVYENQIIFCLDSMLTLEFPTDELVFFVTERGDPSAVVVAITVSLAELVEHHFIDFSIPTTKPIDLHTRRIFPSYRIERAGKNDMMITPPKGHFVDIVQFDKGPIQRGLQAVLSRSDGVLRLALVGGGITVYNRSTPLIRLLFSKPGDPTLVLHTMTVPIHELRTGVKVQLPKILQQPFDLWSPLVYRQNGLIETGEELCG